MTTTRTLLLMRHAEAAAGLMGTDRERELTARGHGQAREAGERLAVDGAVDVAAISASTRTRQTLDGLVEGGLAVARVVERDDLYEAMAPALLRVVRSAPTAARTVLLVGHVPGIPALATVLANDPAAPYPTVRMPKGFAPATCVRLTIDVPWAQVGPGCAVDVQTLTPGGVAR